MLEASQIFAVLYEGGGPLQGLYIKNVNSDHIWQYGACKGLAESVRLARSTGLASHSRGFGNCEPLTTPRFHLWNLGPL